MVLSAFDKIVLRGNDMGVIQRMVDRETPQHIIEAAKPVGTDQEHGGGALSPLSIKAFFGHFLLCGGGIAAAAFCFVLPGIN